MAASPMPSWVARWPRVYEPWIDMVEGKLRELVARITVRVAAAA